MIAHGTAPFLECSSQGDKRFSAFYARIVSRGGASIEEIYQGFKIFDHGVANLTPRQAKGKRALNQGEAAIFYAALWDQYIAENPAFLGVLRAASGLSDVFGQVGHCCQVTELWRIRNTHNQFEDLLS